MPQTQPLYALFLLSGVVAALLFRRRKSGHRGEFVSTIKSLMLGVILPLHIFLSASRMRELDQGGEYLALAVCGALLTISIIGIGYLLSRISALTEFAYPNLVWVGATFGGGGRAVLLAAAFSFAFFANGRTSNLETGDVLNFLAVFDLGYWALFTSILAPVFMPLAFRGNIARMEKRAVGWPVKTMAASVGLSVIISFLQMPLIQALDMSAISAAAEPVRVFLGLLLVFTATFVVIYDTSFENFALSFIDVAAIFALRVAAVLFLILIGAAVYGALNLPPATDTGSVAILLIPLGLMILSPPSSLIPSMIEFAGGTDTQVERAASINTAWNILFLVLVLGMLVIGASLRFL